MIYDRPMDGIRLGCPAWRHLPHLLAWEVRRKSRGARTAWIFSFRRCHKFWIQDDHKFHRKEIPWRKSSHIDVYIINIGVCVCVCACVFVCFLSTCSWCVQYVQMRLLMFFFTRRFRFGLFAFDGKSIKVFSALIAKELVGLAKCPLKMGGIYQGATNQ